MTRGSFAFAAAAFATWVATAALATPVRAAATSAATSPAERAFARTVRPLTAEAVTADLTAATGEHVAFDCSVVSVVDAGAIVGQCGRVQEPVDLYVHLRTAGLRPGARLRVLGEMEAPSQWVDITGHTWYTGFVKARFVHAR